MSGKCNQLFDNKQRIIHCLLLNAPFMSCIGLLNGKMGIVLAFYIYYRHTDCKIYEEFADDLLNNTLECIDNDIDFSFSNGLAGIGWGIEYLIQRGVVAGTVEEICEDIDKKIMETDPRRILDFSLDTGLEGLLHYVLIHISASVKQNIQLPFDEMYLKDLYTVLKQVCQKKDVCNSFKTLSDIYIDFIEKQQEIVYPLDIYSFINIDMFDVDKIMSYPLNLKCGLAGLLLKKYTNG